MSEVSAEEDAAPAEPVETGAPPLVDTTVACRRCGSNLVQREYGDGVLLECLFCRTLMSGDSTTVATAEAQVPPQNHQDLRPAAGETPIGALAATRCPDPLLEHTTSTTSPPGACAHCGAEGVAGEDIVRDRDIDVHWLCTECREAAAQALTPVRMVHWYSGSSDSMETTADNSWGCTSKQKAVIRRELVADGLRVADFSAVGIGYLIRSIVHPRIDRFACPNCVRREWRNILFHILADGDQEGFRAAIARSEGAA